jgi:hypothetical protein
MVLQPFNKDYSNPNEQAWRQGKSPYAGTLGPNPQFTGDPTSFKNDFINRIRFNPDSKGFYTNNVFSQDTAQRSQDKINSAAGTDQPSFLNPEDNRIAQDFVSKYSQAVSRGLVEEDRAITKGGLARLVSQPATAGSSERDPNTANKFPGEGGTQVG